jgi:Outer membrane protein beta-barrel domain
MSKGHQIRCRLLVTALLALMTAFAPLEAQRPISFGVGGGVSLPEGDINDEADIGWHALVTGVMGSAMQPLKLRLDVAYSQLGFSDQTQAALGGTGHFSIGSATLNLSYRLPQATWSVSPYLITGLGAYRTDCSIGPDCGSTVHLGWNFGLGANLYVLGFRNFLEVRWHRTSSHGSGVHYFPVTFGILF